MDAESVFQHVERGMEATSLPFSVTTDWLEDGNETIGNQFEQADWQVGEYRSEIKLVVVRARSFLLGGGLHPAEETLIIYETE